MEDSHLRRIIYFWGTMLIEESRAWKQSAYFWHIKSNTQKTFSYSEETMSVHPLIGYTDSMMNVNLKCNENKASLGKRRYNIKLWKMFSDVFNCMPVVAIIDEKIICMHGGLSPELTSLDQISRIMRPTEIPDTGNTPSF